MFQFIRFYCVCDWTMLCHTVISVANSSKTIFWLASRAAVTYHRPIVCTLYFYILKPRFHFLITHSCSVSFKILSWRWEGTIILVRASLSHTLCASCWSVAWGGFPNVSCYALLSNMRYILQKLISEIESVAPLVMWNIWRTLNKLVFDPRTRQPNSTQPIIYLNPFICG
jgi:hypothetical protein